jgi:alanyl aminopeptidase
MAPLADLYKIMDFVATPDERGQLQQRMREWYRPRLDELATLNSPSTEQIQFRSNLRAALARQARDPEIRASLRQQAVQWAGFEADEQIHNDALDPNEIRPALTVAVEDLGAPFVDLLWRHFLASIDMKQRQDLLISMGFSTDPSSAATMRGRILSPELRGNELYYVFFGQSAQSETRDDLWRWLQENMDAVIEQIPSWNKGGVPRLVGGFCSNEKADDLQAVFGPIIDELESGPRTLANTTERIRLCAAFADFHR